MAGAGARPRASLSDREASGRARRVRWVVLLVPVGIYFFSYFHRIAPVVVVEDVMAAFAASAASVGLLTAIYPWLFAAMALPAGTLADTLGSRRTLTAGATLMALGSAAFGLAPSFVWAFAGRVLVGLGSSVILISWLRLGSAWCRPDEAARLAGLSQTVGAVGGLVGTTPLALLVGAFGWRASFVVIGAATAAAGVACWVGVRDRPPLARNSGRPGPAAASPGLGGILRAAAAVVGNSRSWPPVLVSAGVYGTFVTFIGLWAVPYLTQVYGLSRLDASRYPAAAAFGVVVGAISVGWVSDRLVRRRRLPMIAYATVYAAIWYCLVLPAAPLPLPWLGPLCFLFGLASSGVAIVFAAVPEVNDPARPGTAIGFCNIPTFGMVGLLQWLAGSVLDAAWEGQLAEGARVYSFAAYRAVFLLCTVLATGSAVIAWWITETRCRNVWVSRTVARVDS